MAKLTEAAYIRPKDRVLLADCFVFEVRDVEYKEIDDQEINGRTLEHIIITLADETTTDFTDVLNDKAQQDTSNDTIEIVKDPTDQIPVLEINETAPTAYWRVD